MFILTEKTGKAIRKREAWLNCDQKLSRVIIGRVIVADYTTATSEFKYKRSRSQALDDNLREK